MNVWPGIRELTLPDVIYDKGIQLWQIESREFDNTTDYETYLSTDERRRAARYRVEAHRRRFTIARSALRYILSRKLGCEPASIDFVYGNAGRPEIRRPETTLKFSVSHSESISLIALSDLALVGIDIESPGRVIDLMAVGRTVFCSLEISQLEKYRGSERTKLFYQLWTAKEAVLKMLGTGFTAPLDEFCIINELLKGKPVKIPTALKYTDAPEWIHVQQLDIGNSCYATLATSAD